MAVAVAAVPEAGGRRREAGEEDEDLGFTGTGLATPAPAPSASALPNVVRVQG